MTILNQIPNKYLPLNEREDKPRPEKRLTVRVKFRRGGYATVVARRRWNPLQVNDEGYVVTKDGFDTHEIYASELPALQAKVEGHLEEEQRKRFERQYQVRLQRHMAEKLGIPEHEIEAKVPVDRDKWSDVMRSIEAEYTGSAATEQYQSTFTGHRPFLAVDVVGEKPSLYDEIEDLDLRKQKALLTEVAQLFSGQQLDVNALGAAIAQAIVQAQAQTDGKQPRK